MSVLLQSLLVFSAVLAVYVIWRSIVVIGPAEIGLVVKRVSRRHNTTDTPIAFAGEAGYQAELLMPGVRFKLWPTYIVVRYPWVQVPAGEIGVVISQIGDLVFGGSPLGRALYLSLQAGTVLILVLAANTSFADFPRLASFHAGDNFMPRQLTKRGHLEQGLRPASRPADPLARAAVA